MLIFSQKIYMDSHADFLSKSQHGRQCLFFHQKINMYGHADLFLKKSTWMAMQIFSFKKLTCLAILIFSLKN